jgi:hypothetical protein
MNDIILVFPEVSEDLVSNMMVAITKKIDETGNEIAIQGFLGGEHGYGAHYKNDVFEMRPFYWGDCTCDYDDLRNAWEDSNSHDKDCYQTLFHEMHFVNYGVDWNFDRKPGHGWKKGTIEDECDCVDTLYKHFGIPKDTPGSYVHCTCMYDVQHANFIKTINHSDECQMDKPNFKHYASGIEVEWYKYIGRDMEYDQSIPVEEWVDVFKECLESIKTILKNKESK